MLGKGMYDLPRPVGEPVMIFWLSICPGLGDTCDLVQTWNRDSDC